MALLRRRVRTVAMAILGHAEDAEDAVQCTLLEVLRSAPSFRGGSLYAWTDRIAVRTAARHARRRRVRAAHFDDGTSVEGVSGRPERPSPQHSIPRPILDYLAELPEARRTALVMRHVLEYSVDEIAELTETAPNTVKDRLLQARRQVRRRIRQEVACLPAKLKGDP